MLIKETADLLPCHPGRYFKTAYHVSTIDFNFRFKCAVGGEWKANSEFSQNQLKRWSQKKRHDNDGITSVNIGLVCKVHSGAPQNTTIKCEGPCGQMKVRDAFSKNQRNRPDAVSTHRWEPISIQ